MAILISGESAPNYLTLITDRDKIKAAVTESLDEYLKTNRFGMAPERINIYDPVIRSINHGYKANVKSLYYYLNSQKNEKKIVTRDKLFKYDFLPTAGLDVPVMKSPIAELFKQYCGEKVQIIDVVITLQNGEEITDYKAVNVINRVEAFTWEGSEKGMYYEQYNKPTASSLRVISFDKKVINDAIICKDSVTNINVTLICDELSHELKKHKFKGLGLFSGYACYQIVG
jgi:hypothetical protein